jgi:DNA helicase-2/ATP-dependent DNA helicase PcrA
MLAYLKLVANPYDRSSFFRVVNCPLRGLGNKFEELFYEAWHNEPFATFADIAHSLIERGDITGTKKDALLQFIALFENKQPTDLASKTIEQMIHATSYYGYLKDAYESEEAVSKIENVKELIQAVLHLESQGTNSITLFLEEVALMQAQIQQESNEKDPVLLMTLHAAKGLEFNTVILAGLEEGIMPSTRSIMNEDAIEEERRLFYVGITRAQERLYMSYTRFRYHYGTMNDQRPSRFVVEIPTHMARVQDCSYWSPAQIQDHFNAWFNNKALQPTVVEKPEAFTVKRPELKTGGEISTSSRWKKNQPVSHAKFGLGIIHDVESKSNGTYLHIKFKTGLKKIESQFVTVI